MTRPGLAALALLLLGLPRVAQAQRPLNLDFEMRSVAYPDRPWGWTFGWSAFAAGPPASFTLDQVVRVEGARSLRITASDTALDAPARTLMLQVPATFAHGRTLRLTGRLRTAALTGTAWLTLEAWGDRVVVAADTGRDGGADAGDGWRSLQLQIAVPDDPSVHSIVVQTAVEGSGTAWFDGLALRVNGVPIRALPMDPPPPSAADIRWLTGRSTALDRVQAPDSGGDSGADLQAVARIVGNARVVGLGESTHGTREFFQLKERLVRFLVRQHDFDLFAVEANQLAVERINRYVQGGPGTAPDVMRAMFRVWNTEEMRSLVEWLRAHNAEHPERPVRFIGYDMQDHATPVDTLSAFVAERDAGFLPRLRALTAEYRTSPGYATPQLPDSLRALWRARADSLVTETGARRSAWFAGAATFDDSIRVEWALHAAELFRQAARLNASLNSPDRDSLMAANLDWALRTLYPRSRAVVWAHDVHVSHGGDAARSFNAGAQMGAYLTHAYRYDYRAVSLLTRAGTYTATRSFFDHALFQAGAFPAPAGSVEAMLARLPRPPRSPGVVVDLRVDRTDARGTWLWRPRPVRSIGYAAYDYGFDLTAAMPLEFDGVIFVEQTTGSRMLP